MLVPNAIVSLICGAASAYIARTRGKNPYLWFVLGALFGLFGLLFLFFDSRPGSVKKGHQKSKDPNTIDVTPQFDPSCKEKLWYYLDSKNEQFGPMSFDALLRAYSEQKINRSTYIWTSDFGPWKPFGDIVR